MPDPTAAALRAELEAIAPLPSDGKVTAEALALHMAVRAQRRWVIQLGGSVPMDPAEISAMCAEYAAAHVLSVLADRGAVVNDAHDAGMGLPDFVATQVRDALEDGGGVGEWLWAILGDETARKVGHLTNQLMAVAGPAEVPVAREQWGVAYEGPEQPGVLFGVREYDSREDAEGTVREGLGDAVVTRTVSATSWQRARPPEPERAVRSEPEPDALKVAAAVQRYRHKPTVVEAREITAASIGSVAGWCGGRHVKARESIGGAPWIHVPSLEGPEHGALGDYVIRGAKGEFWVVQGGIFAETYAPADAEDPVFTDGDMIDGLERAVAGAQLVIEAKDAEIAGLKAAVTALEAELGHPSMRTYVNWGVGFNPSGDHFKVEWYDDREDARDHVSFYGPDAFLACQTSMAGSWVRAEPLVADEGGEATTR